MQDADDRPVTEKWIPVGGGGPTNTITHTYDAVGRLTGIVDSNSQYAYTYDDADRLLAVDDAGTTGLPQVTLTYAYDEADRRTSLADSLGGATSYTYDARDRLTRITQSGTGVAPKRVEYSYDDAGRETSLVRYSDLAGSTEVGRTSFAYDSADRLTTLTHLNASGTTLVRYGYGYDAADRTTSESRLWASGSSADSLTYAYTDDGQLASATHSNSSFADESFGYDASGNRNTTGYSTGAGNRLTGDGIYTYTYDAEGNLSAKTEVATGVETLYAWDHRNRLIEVDRRVSGATTVTASFTYDALDRRIGETAGSSVRRTLYDGYSPVLDFNGSGTQVARYLQGLDGVLARETSGGTVDWYLPDRLGTVRDLADGSGAVIDHVDYGAFGGVISESAPSVGDRLVGFAQLERDTATGLNLAIYRAQDPNTGRWLSEDPLKFNAGDINVYRYSSNAPIDHNDKSGLDIYLVPRSLFGSSWVHGQYHYDVVFYNPCDGYSMGFKGAAWPQILGDAFLDDTPQTPGPDWIVVQTVDGDMISQYLQFLELYDMFNAMEQIPGYDPFGNGYPNSNTFARVLLENIGCRPNKPPGAPGWGYSSPYNGYDGMWYDRFGKKRPNDGAQQWLVSWGLWMWGKYPRSMPYFMPRMRP